MAEISNTVINRAVSEQVRPMAEQARNLLVQGQASAPGLSAILASIGQADDADIVQDDRLGEGVAPLTVGQLRDCVGVLSDLVTQINGDARLASILAAGVRPVRTSS